MKNFKIVIAATALSLLSACSSNQNSQRPENDPAYVSPLQYQGYNCKQIGAEMRRISQKLDQKTHAQETAQIFNSALAAFAISQGYGVQDQQDDIELRRLRNKYDVLEEAAIKKECNL